MTVPIHACAYSMVHGSGFCNVDRGTLDCWTVGCLLIFVAEVYAHFRTDGSWICVEIGHW